MNRLSFEKFLKPSDLAAYDFIGDGVSFSFDNASNMSLLAQTEISDGLERLIIRGANRTSNDWLGLDISVPDDVQVMELVMRYAPTERLFPRVHYTAQGSRHQLDEPDRTAPATYGTMRFDTDLWRDMADSDITDISLVLLFPARPWLALGLQSISQVYHA